eukprot:12489230-Heterocapsa_arctica.AAC.1
MLAEVELSRSGFPEHTFYSSFPSGSEGPRPAQRSLLSVEALATVAAVRPSTFTAAREDIRDAVLVKVDVV